MPDKQNKVRRGRPRRFALEDALTTGQALFHAKGYDAVAISEITEAIGIKSPSFYAAFGSKAAYFQAILSRYESLASPISVILDDSRPLVDILADLFVAAAHAYSADAIARGCLVMETLRGSGDTEVLAMVRSLVDARGAKLRELIGRSSPDAAQAINDYVLSVLSGLSACARQGWSRERLVSVARAASAGVSTLLTKEP